MKFLIDTYNDDLTKLSKFSKEKKLEKLNASIKWTRAVKNDFVKGIVYKFDSSKVTSSFYRPFVKKALYYDKHLNEMQYQMPQMILPTDTLNKLICFTVGGRLDFATFATNLVPSLTVLSLDANQCLSFYRVHIQQQNQAVDYRIASLQIW